MHLLESSTVLGRGRKVEEVVKKTEMMTSLQPLLVLGLFLPSPFTWSLKEEDEGPVIVGATFWVYKWIISNEVTAGTRAESYIHIFRKRFLFYLQPTPKAPGFVPWY